jgi:ubiquitin-protein ligase
MKEKDEYPYIKIVSVDNLFRLVFLLSGPENSIYEGKQIEIILEIP